MKREPTDCLVVRQNGNGWEYGVQRYREHGSQKLKYGHGDVELTEFIKLGSAATLEEALKRNKMSNLKEAP